MQKLTPREKDIYLFILDYREKHGYSPSIRDICKGVYISQTRGVLLHIERLIDKGYIDYTPKVARSIVIKKESANV